MCLARTDNAEMNGLISQCNFAHNRTVLTGTVKPFIDSTL